MVKWLRDELQATANAMTTGQIFRPRGNVRSRKTIVNLVSDSNHQENTRANWVETQNIQWDTLWFDWETIPQ